MGWGDSGFSSWQPVCKHPKHQTEVTAFRTNFWTKTSIPATMIFWGLALMWTWSRWPGIKIDENKDNVTIQGECLDTDEGHPRARFASFGSPFSGRMQT